MSGGTGAGGDRRRLVVKIGSSSVTADDGTVETALIGRVCDEIVALREQGRQVVVVTSGAIAVGWAALGRSGRRPSEPAVLQAVSAVGQHRLMRTWEDGLAPHGLLAGQVLLAPLDFVHRQQYLHARGTLEHLLELGVVPVVNENDAVADEEIRFGDNDRLGALVAHLAGADLLVLLTDAPGLRSGRFPAIARALGGDLSAETGESDTRFIFTVPAGETRLYREPPDPSYSSASSTGMWCSASVNAAWGCS